MPRFAVARMHKRERDILLVPLEAGFGAWSEDDRQVLIAELQARACAAGLRGTVIPVWDGGRGRMAFIAPMTVHPFLKQIDLDVVMKRINGEIAW